MENWADIISWKVLKIYVRSGPKKQGQIVQIQLIWGVYDTKESNINFAGPPGLIDEVLTGLPEINDGNNTDLLLMQRKFLEKRERSLEMMICLDSNKKCY